MVVWNIWEKNTFVSRNMSPFLLVRRTGAGAALDPELSVCFSLLQLPRETEIWELLQTFEDFFLFVNERTNRRLTRGD